jgi:hypothetical protein
VAEGTQSGRRRLRPGHPERGIPGLKNHRTLFAVILFVVAPALSVAAAKVGFYGFFERRLRPE